MSGQRRDKRHKSVETSHSVGTVQLHVTVPFVWFHVLKYSVFRLLRMLLTSLNLFDMSWRSLSCRKSAKRVCMAMPLLPCPSQALSEPLPRVKLSMKPPPIMARVMRDSEEEIRSGHMQSVLVSNWLDVECNSIGPGNSLACPRTHRPRPFPSSQGPSRQTLQHQPVPIPRFLFPANPGQIDESKSAKCLPDLPLKFTLCQVSPWRHPFHPRISQFLHQLCNHCLFFCILMAGEVVQFLFQLNLK